MLVPKIEYTKYIRFWLAYTKDIRFWPWPWVGAANKEKFYQNNNETDTTQNTKRIIVSKIVLRCMVLCENTKTKYKI